MKMLMNMLVITKMFADWCVCRENVYGYLRVFVMKMSADMFVCLSMPTRGDKLCMDNIS